MTWLYYSLCAFWICVSEGGKLSDKINLFSYAKIVSSSRVVFFLCTCLAALPLFSSMFCEKAVTERWTHGRRFPQRGTKPQAFLFSGTLEVRTDLLTTPWQLYGLALWGWPVPHRTNLWSAAGKAAALIWTHVLVWKDWGPVPIFFYQLSIAIWRTIAQPGTLPTVAHCIQVMVIFFYRLVRRVDLSILITSHQHAFCTGISNCIVSWSSDQRFEFSASCEEAKEVLPQIGMFRHKHCWNMKHA